MTAHLDRIARLNPRFNAIVALGDRDALLNEARDADAALARGAAAGALHGLPFAVKDLQALRGYPMTMGSPLLAGFRPAADSLMVARLRAAGVIFVGKTNTPEFGLGSHTDNRVYGATRNAYDPALSAGGSSGGAAVAVALGMLPLADGSDYGGSLRNPAGWNGIFGLRPSIGRVPMDATDGWLPSMSVLGPMARSVRDLAVLMAVQSGYDPRAPLSIPGDGSAFLGSLDRDLAGLRLAWGGDLHGHTPCEPGVLAVCERALRALEAHGCHVEAAAPDFDYPALWQAAQRLRAWQLGALLLPYYRNPATRAVLGAKACFEVETGLALSAYDVAAASAVRGEWAECVRRFLERYDALVLPTAQVFPFPVGDDYPDAIAGRPMRTYHEWMQAALLVTFSGCPALAAPAGFDAAGRPMGVQFVVPNRGELDALRIASAYERAVLPDLHRPPLAA